MPGVEVIWPADGSSPIDRLVKPGQGIISHLCYTSDQPERCIAAMEEAGLNVILIGELKPAVLFGTCIFLGHFTEKEKWIERAMAIFLPDLAGIFVILVGRRAALS
jgi:hypothetical protein